MATRVKSHILHHPPLKTSLVPETNPWRILSILNHFQIHGKSFLPSNPLHSFEIRFKFILSIIKFRGGSFEDPNTCTLHFVHRRVFILSNSAHHRANNTLSPRLLRGVTHVRCDVDGCETSTSKRSIPHRDDNIYSIREQSGCKASTSNG